MTDRVFTNGVDADGSAINLRVKDGRFTAIGPDVPTDDGLEIVDLLGELVLPGFVDGHIHLDKSFLGDRWHSHRPAASLQQRLDIEKQALGRSSSGPTR